MVLSLILYTTIGLTVVGAGLYLAGAYNQRVSSTREADRAFANVEVSLKQRHDELSPLVGAQPFELFSNVIDSLLQ